MAVNSVRNAPSVDRIAQVVELIDKERGKKSPKWRDAVKRGLRDIEGVSPRNFADGQTAFLVKCRLENPDEPDRLETDLYQIAREELEKLEEAAE